MTTLTTTTPTQPSTTTTSTSSNAEESSAIQTLPDRTFGVMVHKIYEARLLDAWRPAAVEFLEAVHSRAKVSQNRRGFHVLLCREIGSGRGSSKGYHHDYCLPTRLSPCARQNISWMARLQYYRRVVVVDTSSSSGAASRNLLASSSSSTSSSAMATSVWQTLAEDPSFDRLTDRIRVDVFPRTLLEPVCGALQARAHASLVDDDDETPLPSDPFEGPLQMTASRSQSTLRLTVVLVPEAVKGGDHDKNAASRSVTTCYWGMDRRPRDNALLDLELNQEANAEMAIVAMQPSDGKEPIPAPHPTIPLSRAYYKLAQVWTDELQPRCLDLANGAGLDLGASPGGWTQILLHDVGLSTVVCVDPAVMAQRVLRHPGVRHVPHRLQDWRRCQTERHGTAFSAVVCDASVLWSTLLDDLSTHVVPFTRWTLPVVLVLTCKLPFRTAGSIARHVQGIRERVPDLLDEWKPYFVAAASTATATATTTVRKQGVAMEWKLLHLFANSESERTLLIVVKEAPPSSSTLTSAAEATDGTMNPAP